MQTLAKCVVPVRGTRKSSLKLSFKKKTRESNPALTQATGDNLRNEVRGILKGTLNLNGKSQSKHRSVTSFNLKRIPVA
ncbi:MAG: hypothetical protein WKF70_09165 [Chitinophagaceae bacterium]